MKFCRYCGRDNVDDATNCTGCGRSDEFETAPAPVAPLPPQVTTPLKPLRSRASINWICPDCRGTLVTLDGKKAHCVVHHGEFEILFSRWTPPQVIPDDRRNAIAAGDVKCQTHPAVAAVTVCEHCGIALCHTCRFEQPNGRNLCAGCVEGNVSNPAFSSQLTPPLIGNPGIPVPPGSKCKQHPNVLATFVCKLCAAPICPTCDFVQPGGFHVCPSCISSTDRRMTAKRRGLLIGAFALAVWSTLGLGVLLSGLLADWAKTESDEALLGLGIIAVIFVPTLLGLVLSCCAFEKKLGNPPSVWVAVIWNSLLAAGLVLLSIVGQFMQ